MYDLINTCRECGWTERYVLLTLEVSHRSLEKADQPHVCDECWYVAMMDRFWVFEKVNAYSHVTTRGEVLPFIASALELYCAIVCKVYAKHVELAKAAVI